MRDLELLTARFMTCQLAKEDEWLRKYFPAPNQERLIVYYRLFPYTTTEAGNGYRKFIHNFMDHTGIHCSYRWVFKHIGRLRNLEARLRRAEREFDIQTVAAIKSGEMRWSQIKSPPPPAAT